MGTFELRIYPTLEHCKVVILSSVFKKYGHFKNLCKLSTQIWNLNSASLHCLGVTSIYVEDVIFEGVNNGCQPLSPLPGELRLRFSMQTLMQSVIF